MKLCRGCDIEKACSEFNKYKSAPDGLQPRCRACQKVYNEARRHDPAIIERRKQYDRDRYYANVEVSRKRVRDYNREHAEERQAYTRAWRLANLEKIKETDTLDKQRLRWQKRRAIKRDAFVETVRSEEIYKRDNYICQLCFAPVDINLKWPDPMSHSLDHIVPLSKGGEHSRANTQLAHIGCNWKKNNKV
jgi:5-methylcytosine-specific restriction endonuclease McrA